MARILLGVSGGIAAYKALELARLATVAGHGVRVLMTESADRFVGAASFEGIVGAPVLTSEFERDPLRGAFPGDPRARARPDRAPRAGRQLRRLPGRAGLGQHDRQAGGGYGGLDAHHLLPRLLVAASGRPGDERPHVRRRRDPGKPGDAARARRRGDRARRGPARLARRVRQGAAAGPGAAARPRRSRAAGGRAPLGRAARPGHRRRYARADRPGPLPRQPLQRPHGHSPGRRRSPPRRRGDPDRRQCRAARARRRAAHRRRDGRASWRRRPEAEFPEATCS